ncbi:MAG: glycosyltransferase family 2 protein [Saprospiraceae bacterium]|nr:glycosyltransferase family 2 protein [Saprospiraceae bacterium]
MRVSIIIPVYNAENFLDKSISSALNQDQTAEVILIDDRSTDSSWKKCQKWVRKDVRVKLFRNEGLKGAGAARNIGLRNSNCDFIAFLDADDYYLDRRFEDDENTFNNYKSISGISNAVQIKTFNQLDHIILNTLYRHDHVYKYSSNFSVLEIKEIILRSEILIQGCTFRKSFILHLGGFDENLKQCQDTDLIYRAVCKGTMMSSNNNPVVIYNIHSNNTIKNTSETIIYRLKFTKKAFHFLRSQKIPTKLQIKILKTYSELIFLRLFSGKVRFKKLIKILILPYILYTLFNKDTSK